LVASNTGLTPVFEHVQHVCAGIRIAVGKMIVSLQDGRILQDLYRTSVRSPFLNHVAGSGAGTVSILIVSHHRPLRDRFGPVYGRRRRSQLVCQVSSKLQRAAVDLRTVFSQFENWHRRTSYRKSQIRAADILGQLWGLGSANWFLFGFRKTSISEGFFPGATAISPAWAAHQPATSRCGPTARFSGLRRDTHLDQAKPDQFPE